MKYSYFENELAKVRERFNQTFGTMIVCDIRARQITILSICFMGRLSNSIMTTKRKQDAHDDIRKFVRRRNLLNQIFDQLDEVIKQKETAENQVVLPDIVNVQVM